jgi:hypothetical protein
MSVRDAVSQYVPCLRRNAGPGREVVLRAKPLRNPEIEWEHAGVDEVCLLIPRSRDLLGKALCRIFRAPSHKRVTLDEVGSFVWELCDGEHSIEQIVNATGKKYNITRRECETSVGVYLKTLGERRYVALRQGGRKKK